MVERVHKARPDVVFVCLGAPKQERFMAAHQQELTCGLMIGLGGSLDGFAGVVKRAPQWMIRCNLEWLYRLLKDPSRLGPVSYTHLDFRQKDRILRIKRKI